MGEDLLDVRVESFFVEFQPDFHLVHEFLILGPFSGEDGGFVSMTLDFSRRGEGFSDGSFFFAFGPPRGRGCGAAVRHIGKGKGKLHVQVQVQGGMAKTPPTPRATGVRVVRGDFDVRRIVCMRKSKNEDEHGGVLPAVKNEDRKQGAF